MLVISFQFCVFEMGSEDIGAAFNNLAQQMTGLSSTIKS
jgi:hypothetical protein